MADFIKREDFEKLLLESARRFAQNSEEDETDVYGAVLAAAYLAIYEAVLDFPSADVRENVPGKWKKNALFETPRCSVCGTSSNIAPDAARKWREAKMKEKTIPAQCRDCLKRKACEEAGCLKEKPCRARAEPEKLDADLIDEVKWRWS